MNYLTNSFSINNCEWSQRNDGKSHSNESPPHPHPPPILLHRLPHFHLPSSPPFPSHRPKTILPSPLPPPLPPVLHFHIHLSTPPPTSTSTPPPLHPLHSTSTSFTSMPTYTG